MTFIMHTDPLSDDFETDDTDEEERTEDSTGTGTGTGTGERKKRNAILNSRGLWPGRIVPYEISSFFIGESLRGT